MQSPLRLIYPAQCVSCGEPVDSDFGLCGKCWAKTAFINGHVCNLCGTPLPGDEGAEDDRCDDCMTIARPWSRGRAALLYRDNARRLVLALKHSDRLDLARPAARWMARAALPILSRDVLIVPIPAHWTRVFKRRYNQAAELARALGAETGLEVAPTAMIRPNRTGTQDGKGIDARFANLQGAIRPHPKRGGAMQGRKVLLVDDVMTSGATFAAAAEAAHDAGAAQVVTLALARVAKDT